MVRVIALAGIVCGLVGLGCSAPYMPKYTSSYGANSTVDKEVKSAEQECVKMLNNRRRAIVSRYTSRDILTIIGASIGVAGSGTAAIFGVAGEVEQPTAEQLAADPNAQPVVDDIGREGVIISASAGVIGALLATGVQALFIDPEASKGHGQSTQQYQKGLEHADDGKNSKAKKAFRRCKTSLGN